MRTCPILGKFILCTCSNCIKQVSISEAIFAALIAMNKPCHSEKNNAHGLAIYVIVLKAVLKPENDKKSHIYTLEH